MKWFSNKIVWKVISVVMIMIFAFLIVVTVKEKAKYYENNLQMIQHSIDTQEKVKTSIVVNILDCIKEFDEEEYDALIKILEADNIVSEVDTEEFKIVINAIVEQNPELANSEEYKTLMDELITTEEKIAYVESNFVNWLEIYDSYINHFPTKQILRLVKYSPVEYKDIKG